MRVRILLVSNRLWLVAKPDVASKRTPNSTAAEHRCIPTPIWVPAQESPADTVPHRTAEPVHETPGKLSPRFQTDRPPNLGDPANAPPMLPINTADRESLPWSLCSQNWNSRNRKLSPRRLLRFWPAVAEPRGRYRRPRRRASG